MSLSPARLWALLGHAVPPQTPPQVELGTSEALAHGHLTRFRLIDGDTAIPGLCIVPNGQGPHPAVLYAHAHGNRYDIGAEELMSGRPALQSPYGPALAEMGFASLCIDLAPFGTRQGAGPEGALAKATLWQGRTLLGDMLRELTLALSTLQARPEIDAGRIATLGVSMGGTLAYWLAALDRRVMGTVHLCVLSDIAPLIARGDHDLHGPYMTVPGLLREADMSDVAALVAPRPQFVGLGGLDPLTPDLPDSSAVRALRTAYHATPDALTLHLEAQTGHQETPQMRRAVLSFLQTHLLRPPFAGPAIR